MNDATFDHLVGALAIDERNQVNRVIIQSTSVVEYTSKSMVIHQKDRDQSAMNADYPAYFDCGDCLANMVRNVWTVD